MEGQETPTRRGWRNWGLAGVLILVTVLAAAAVVRPRSERLQAPPAGTDAATVSDSSRSDAVVGGAGDSEPVSDTAAAAPAMMDADAMFAFPAITDGVPRVSKPEHVRALYLNAWATGSSRRLDQLIALAQRTEINAFVIDVKEGGEISYRSAVPLARQIGADQAHIPDVRAVLRRLREAGIYPIARIVLFRDARLADARPEWAVQHQDGGEWVDRDGHHWVDSFNRHVWDYNIAIAREALQLGFSEVQWDYVRFPDVPQSLMRTARWPAQEGRTKADAIREFLQYSRDQLNEYDVPITADVFGLTVSVRNDMGIGQLWEKMVDVTDVLLPMVYPSHFARGSYGIPHPNADPYQTVLKAMQFAVRRTEGVENAAGIRPWLQDFTLGSPRYDAAHVRAQIDAVRDAGLTEWVLWNPGSRYTEDALADPAGRAPRLPRPGPQQPAPDSTPASGSTGVGTPPPIGVPDSVHVSS